MSPDQQRLIVPAVGGIYRSFDGMADAMIRIALGALLLPHGLQKLFGWFGGQGLAANTALFDKLGYSPGWLWGNIVAGTEFAGAILLIIGLFTRPAALAVGIFTFNAILFTSKTGGYFWLAKGSEYSILLFVCALFVLIRGAGAFSLDRAIGREF
jgi:putative oxidoreductase